MVRGGGMVLVGEAEAGGLLGEEGDDSFFFLNLAQKSLG